jgi:hypothetical protein
VNSEDAAFYRLRRAVQGLAAGHAAVLKIASLRSLIDLDIPSLFKECNPQFD